MDNSLIELFPYKGNPFWQVFAAAILILVPISVPSARRYVLAAINVGFVVLLLRTRCLPVGVFLIVSYLLLRLIELRRLRFAAVCAAGAGTFGLFLVHKLPGLAAQLQVGELNPILTTIGFSYIALRSVELLRAVAEGTHSAPTPGSMINYLVPFHMIAAGPIQSYDDFVAQPELPRALGFPEALAATERIISGLFKKFVLAQCLKRLFLSDFRSGGFYFFLEVQFNYLWIYLDFSAYSDIAVGIGALLGVATPENFNRPYLARNVIDFWERWHISLSQFIRRNVFTPIQLALMRLSEGRHPLWIASFALATSFVLCGLWHQVSLRFLLWGAFHAVGLIACNLYKHALAKKIGRKGVKRYLENPWFRVFSTFLTFEFVAFSLLIVGYKLNVVESYP
jgi:D-alanyl-lipoteichoic acid acyltransferase DltB (MBOAT superfamily)